MALGNELEVSLDKTEEWGSFQYGVVTLLRKKSNEKAFSNQMVRKRIDESSHFTMRKEATKKL